MRLNQKWVDGLTLPAGKHPFRPTNVLSSPAWDVPLLPSARTQYDFLCRR